MEFNVREVNLTCYSFFLTKVYKGNPLYLVTRIGLQCVSSMPSVEHLFCLFVFRRTFHGQAWAFLNSVGGM